jgi:molybdopterin converting factor small subunit
MEDKEILLKLRRNLLAEAKVRYSKDKAVAELFDIKENLEIEVGKLKSYVAELEDKLSQRRSTKREWLKDDLIKSMDEERVKLTDKYKDCKNTMEEWRRKYLNTLVKTKGENNDNTAGDK